MSTDWVTSSWVVVIYFAGLLPQAHTCTNTLELPDYWSALQETASAAERVDEDALEELMLSKFVLAIGNSWGYGLDS